MNHLNGLLISDDESRAKRFMPPDYFIQSALERGDLERTLQPERRRNVVKAISRIVLVQKPQSLLSE